jgi:hypothetical protein
MNSFYFIFLHSVSISVPVHPLLPHLYLPTVFFFNCGKKYCKYKSGLGNAHPAFCSCPQYVCQFLVLPSPVDLLTFLVLILFPILESLLFLPILPF